MAVKGKERYVQLSAEYVASAVQLGYAATDYGNQGVTADRSATWVGPATSAGGLYVGASRGRWKNTVHVVAEGPEQKPGTSWPAAVRRDRADRGLEAARARAEAEALRPTPSANPPRRRTRRVAQPGRARRGPAPGGGPAWPTAWPRLPRCPSPTTPPGGPRPKPTGRRPSRAGPQRRGTRPRPLKP